MLKVCTKCDQLKVHEAKGMCSDCYRKEKHKVFQREWYKNNKQYFVVRRGKNKTHYKNLDLQRRYGITLEIYNKILKQQRNKCAICRKKETMIDPRTQKVRPLCVDHCHKTGKVRGLLCNSCNNGLGRFKDNLNLVLRTVKYLIKYRGDNNVRQ
jgi:hypothetical protein